VSPLDVAGGSDAGDDCYDTRQIALNDAKGEQPGDQWNRREYGQTRDADPSPATPTRHRQSGHQDELSRRL